LKAGLLLAFLCAGCVQFSWNRESRYAPVSPQAIESLDSASSDLESCLQVLGAPLWVLENVENGRQGAVLAYGWFDQASFGLNVSVPVSEAVSASLDLDRIDRRMHGLVLFFDEDWRLSSWRQGLLRDLTRAVRHPPAVLEEDA
jgi:hypothetical protein